MDLQMAELLSSFTNKIKYIGNQHSIILEIKEILKKPAHHEHLFIAEGIWLHEKLLSKPFDIITFVFCPECIHSEEGLHLLKTWLMRCELSYVFSKKLMVSLSSRDDVDGFMSIVTFPNPQLHQLQLKDDAVILILDGLESPGNIGTILRTSDGAGVDAVFLYNSKISLNHPKVIKSSMGAVLEIPIFEFEDIYTCSLWLEENHFKIYLADTRAVDTFKMQHYGKRTALVMGNERYGISKEWYEKKPHLISIPMLGNCDSLNVGVAAAIITYEICSKRKLIKEGVL